MGHRARGFTLIEMMIVVAIIGVVAGLAGIAFTGLRPKAEVRTSVADVSAQLEAAGRRARSNGSTVWVGLLLAADPEPLRLVVYEDWNGNFDPGTFDPADPAAQVDQEAGTGAREDRLVQFLRLPEAVEPVAGSAFRDFTKVPLPFRTVNPADVTGCSFCDAVGGWLRFTPAGEVRVRGGDGSGAGLFLSAPSSGGGAANTHYFIAVTEPFGLVRSFDDA